ncbi:MAG: glycoside hydrolase family 3 C-terminal domain-containing protein [Actinomycetes bacterium]
MMSELELGELIANLTLAEKSTVLAGLDFWNTVGVERVGLPSVTVTDGPAGARGSALLGFGAVTAVCVPCGAALGSTWDPALIERVGEMLGDETRTKAARVLLAPTVNIVRSPLAGRNFECYSEDPFLTGKIAAGFIRGVQSRGVATTVKHFVGNEAEFERHTMSSVIDERTLREVYLLPFELAVKEGGSLGIMTAYNRLNGQYCTDRAELLQGILRDEWGFQGFVVTDWIGAGSTVTAAQAGVDLEMPGPGRFYGPALKDAVERGEVDEALVDAAITRLLTVFNRIGALDDKPGAEEESIDRPEHRVLARQAASSAMVLLANDGLLPLDVDQISTLAVIGPNVDRAQIMGGGSAALRAHYVVTPLQAIRSQLGDSVSVVYERGCDIDLVEPAMQGDSIATADGSSGFDVEFFTGTDIDAPPVARTRMPDSRLLFIGSPHRDVPTGTYSFRATTTFTPAESGAHRFTLGQSGRARVRIDGEVVLDGVTNPPPGGTRYFGVVSANLECDVALEVGKPIQISIEYSSEDSTYLRGVLVGCRRPIADDLIERAVSAAASADVAVVIVGTNDDWETEGEDRTSIRLPGSQDELVERVLAANPRTVVVLNTGAPVMVPWADDAAALLQMWFGGQEMARSLVDVLTGVSDPGGRLAVTMPERIEDNPSYGNFPGENGEVRYGEGLLVGYRWYQTRRIAPRFSFGHGLSYSSFDIGAPRGGGGPLVWTRGNQLVLQVPVSNVGGRAGSEVVQVYVEPPTGPKFRPDRELKAFAKVALAASEETTVDLVLDDRSFATWEPSVQDWVISPGRYAVHIGRSSAETAYTVFVDIGD